MAFSLAAAAAAAPLGSVEVGGVWEGEGRASGAGTSHFDLRFFRGGSLTSVKLL